MKKLICLLLCMFMLLSLFAGCGTTAQESEEVTEAEVAQEETVEESVDYSGVKVGLLLNQPKTDNGWSQAMAQSLERTRVELGMSEDQIIIVESIPDASTEADSTIVQLIDEGCNLIIGGSSGFTTNMNAAYANYPDVYFTQFEGESADNYCSFTCMDIEAIFMCGYAAALMSDVDEMGFVAAQPQSSVIRAINAWSAGAKAANPNATVRVMWVNSWFDPATEKECATTLLESGMKSLGYHSGTTAVCEACEAAGAYVTGFHTDKEAYAPKAVLTSFCWNWTPIFNEIVTQVATDTWTSDTKYANMADGAATIAPWNEDIMPQEVIDQCNEMYDAIVSGEYVVLEGPVYDNQGNEVLAEGNTFTIEELVDCYFLLDNVIGELP